MIEVGDYKNTADALETGEGAASSVQTNGARSINRLQLTHESPGRMTRRKKTATIWQRRRWIDVTSRDLAAAFLMHTRRIAGCVSGGRCEVEA